MSDTHRKTFLVIFVFKSDCQLFQLLNNMKFKMSILCYLVSRYTNVLDNKDKKKNSAGQILLWNVVTCF